MIGLCTRCGAGFEGSEEDVNDPGDDCRGPECPACYRRRKALERIAGGLPGVQPCDKSYEMQLIAASAIAPAVSS